MKFDLKVLYKTELHHVLCFKCAVREVVDNDRDVEVLVDDFSSEYDMRSTTCEVCGKWIN